jgi:single-strand DNA-binding protein
MSIKEQPLPQQNAPQTETPPPSSVNRVLLIGNVGEDPYIFEKGDGRKIAFLSLATSDEWQDQRGIRHKRTHWHRVVVYNTALANRAEKAVKKGSKVYVVGKLRSSEWVDVEGHNRQGTEVAVTARGGEMVIFPKKKRTSKPSPPEQAEK